MTTVTETKKILIVDNEPAVLLSLSYSLRSMGVEVVTASRLESAEAALEKYFFDLVIADIRMSGVLGIEGLEDPELRQKKLAGNKGDHHVSFRLG